MEQGGNMKQAVIYRDSYEIYYISYEYNYWTTLILISRVTVSMTIGYSYNIICVFSGI